MWPFTPAPKYESYQGVELHPRFQDFVRSTRGAQGVESLAEGRASQEGRHKQNRRGHDAVDLVSTTARNWQKIPIAQV